MTPPVLGMQTDLSALRMSIDGNDAHGRLYIFPRVRKLWCVAASQGRRLLRILFLRERRMSSDSTGEVVLQQRAAQREA